MKPYKNEEKSCEDGWKTTLNDFIGKDLNKKRTKR